MTLIYVIVLIIFGIAPSTSSLLPFPFLILLDVLFNAWQARPSAVSVEPERKPDTNNTCLSEQHNWTRSGLLLMRKELVPIDEHVRRVTFGPGKEVETCEKCGAIRVVKETKPFE